MILLKRRLEAWIRQSVWLTSFAFLADNLLATVGLRRANPSELQHLSGQVIEADIAYASSVVANYAKWGSIRGGVAEVGPGGSAATGLMLIDRGADRVDLPDRFIYPHDQAKLDRTYETIIGRSERLKAVFPNPPRLDPHICFHSGEPAAAERFFQDHGGYDLICSCAVLEHLFDPITAIERMAQALKPGGRMIHYIDFRDHGMFTGGGMHELTFLKMPGWLYTQMSRRRGRPNRVLIDRYRAVCERLGLEYRIAATSLVGVGLIEHQAYADLAPEVRARAEARVLELRDRLSPPYRDMGVEDLAIDSIALVATKPIGTPGKAYSSAGGA